MNNNDHAIDPVTLAILKGRFEQIADEMDQIFKKLSDWIFAQLIRHENSKIIS